MPAPKGKKNKKRGNPRHKDLSGHRREGLQYREEAEYESGLNDPTRKELVREINRSKGSEGDYENVAYEDRIADNERRAKAKLTAKDKKAAANNAAGKVRLMRRKLAYTPDKPVAGEYTIKPDKIVAVTGRGKTTYDVKGIAPPTRQNEDGNNRSRRRSGIQPRPRVPHPENFKISYLDGNMSVVFADEVFELVYYTTLPKPDSMHLVRVGGGADDNYVTYVWNLSRVSRNRLLHALNGNIAPMIWRELFAAHAARAISTWAISRLKRNRLQHASNGNPTFFKCNPCDREFVVQGNVQRATCAACKKSAQRTDYLEKKDGTAKAKPPVRAKEKPKHEEKVIGQCSECGATGQLFERRGNKPMKPVCYFCAKAIEPTIAESAAPNAAVAARRVEYTAVEIPDEIAEEIAAASSSTPASEPSNKKVEKTAEKAGRSGKKKQLIEQSLNNTKSQEQGNADARKEKDAEKREKTTLSPEGRVIDVEPHVTIQMPDTAFQLPNVLFMQDAPRPWFPWTTVIGATLHILVLVCAVMTIYYITEWNMSWPAWGALCSALLGITRLRTAYIRFELERVEDEANHKDMRPDYLTHSSQKHRGRIAVYRASRAGSCHVNKGNFVRRFFTRYYDTHLAKRLSKLTVDVEIFSQVAPSIQFVPTDFSISRITNSVSRLATVNFDRHNLKDPLLDQTLTLLKAYHWHHTAVKIENGYFSPYELTVPTRQ